MPRRVIITGHRQGQTVWLKRQQTKVNWLIKRIIMM